MIRPYDNWVLAKLECGQVLNGELDTVSKEFKEFFVFLNGLSPDERIIARKAFLYSRADRDAIVQSVASFNPCGEPPSVEAVGEWFTADLGDLDAADDAGNFIWPFHLVRQHLNLLSANVKIGKTHFALDLVRRIFFRDVWPDGAAPTFEAGTKTLWICGDRHQKEVRDRAVEFGLPVDAILLNATKGDAYGGLDLDDEQTVSDLRKRVEDKRPGLVVIDTVWRTTQRRLHHPSEVNQFVDPLLKIARECDTTFLGLMHLSKDNETIGRRLEGAARSILKLSWPDPGQPDRRRLTIIGNFKQPPPLGVTLHDKGCNFDHTPPEESQGSNAKAQSEVERGAKVLTDLLTNGPVGSNLCVSQANKAFGRFKKSQWWREDVLKGRLGGQCRKLGNPASWFFWLNGQIWPPSLESITAAMQAEKQQETQETPGGRIPPEGDSWVSCPELDPDRPF